MSRVRTPLTVALAVLSLLVAALGAASTADAGPPSVVTGDLDSRIDRYVADYLDTHGLPGASVAVVRDGEIVHEAGFGEDADGDPVTPDTRMRTASVSKSFTALAVLRLVDRGSVGLDQPVVEVLPELRVDDPRAGRITVRQLLSHTSGLVTPTVIGPADTLQEGVARTRDWPLASDPGSTYAYSNADYWVLARLVEVVEDRPFGEVLADEVFTPLGMTRTVDTVTTRDPVGDLADGHVPAYGASIATADPVQMVDGAGGVVSTAHDLSRWLTMQQRGGVSDDGTRLLPAALVEESFTPAPSAGRSGLGWMRSSAHPDRVGHSGVEVTRNAQQTLDLATGWGAVVLLDSGSAVREHAYEISEGVLALTEGAEPEVGPPVAIFVDLALGALTLLAVGLGLLAVRRARRWSERRRRWGPWRLGLRLLPQLVAPAVAAFVLLVAPGLQDNSLTPADAFRIFPALTVLLVALGLVGVAVVGARVAARLRTSRAAT